MSLIFVLYTYVLMYPCRKKSSGIKSEERAAKEVGPPRSIYLSWLNFRFNHVQTSLEKSADALSC